MTVVHTIYSWWHCPLFSIKAFVICRILCRIISLIVYFQPYHLLSIYYFLDMMLGGSKVICFEHFNLTVQKLLVLFIFGVTTFTPERSAPISDFQFAWITIVSKRPVSKYVICMTVIVGNFSLGISMPTFLWKSKC